MALKLGLDAKLYIDTNTNFGTPTWSEVSNCMDLTLALEKNDADVTTRGNNGWRAKVGVLKDATLDWKMIYDTADANFTKVRDAFLNNNNVHIAVMDGDIGDAGTEGFEAVMSILKFSKNEPLEEAQTVDVSATPTYYPALAPMWNTVS